MSIMESSHFLSIRRSDIFLLRSLGALLYEMLTGLPPFYSRDREKLFEKIRKDQLSYPKYLSENAKLLLRGVSSAGDLFLFLENMF